MEAPRREGGTNGYLSRDRVDRIARETKINN